MDLRSKNLWKSVESTTHHHNILRWMLYTNTPEGRNDGHRQAEDGCGLKGHLVGLMAPRPTCWHRSFMQQRAMSFNKRFQEKVLKVLGGFQVFWLSHAVTFSLQMWKLVQSMWKICHVYSSQWSLIISIFDIWIKIFIAAGRNDNSMALTMASWVIPQWFKPSHHQRQEYREAAQANLRKATTDVTRVPGDGGWKDENDFLWFHTAYM